MSKRCAASMAVTGGDDGLDENKKMCILVGSTEASNTVVTLDLAREELTLIMQEEAQHELPRALQLLRQHPILASEAFPCEIAHEDSDTLVTELFPLFYFAYLKAELNVVEEVYNMYPRAVSERINNSQEGLFVFICKYGAADGVIAFLAGKNPDAISDIEIGDESLGMTALQAYLKYPYMDCNPDCFRTLQKLVELNPCVLVERDRCCHTALDTALSSRDTECIHYVFDHVPKGVSFFFTDVDELTLDGAKGIAKILPQLREFSISGGIQPEAFIYLTKCLSHNASISKLTLTLPESVHVNHGMLTEIIKSLQEMIETNTTVCQLALGGKSQGRISRQHSLVYLRALETAFQTNNTIHSLCICNLTFSKSGALSSFLFSKNAPGFVKVAGVDVVGGWACSSLKNRNCQIKDIHIHIETESQWQWVEGWLEDDIVNMNSLTSLSILHHGLNKTDYKDAILSAVRKLKLKSIIVENVIVNVESLCALLRCDKTLTRLDISSSIKDEKDVVSILGALEDNTTLEKVEVPHTLELRDLSQKIVYLTALNRFGRGRVRDQSTSLSDLIDMLGEVWPKTEYERILASRRESEGDFTEVSVCYGLLREAPGLWASNGEKINSG